MKTKRLTLLAIIIATASFSQTFTVAGLDYEVISTTPNEVKITGGTPATTDLVIPPSVTDNGTTYSVTIIGVEAFGFADYSVPAIVTSVSIPNTIRIIENAAFAGNQLTGDLILPNSVIAIGGTAFSSNQITSVTLSENLSEIPISTFTGNNITQVTALATVAPSIVTSSFSDVSSATLNIPAGTLTSYINNGWGVFGTIIAGGITFQSALTVNDINYFVKGLQPNEVSVRGQAGALTTIDIPATVSNAGTTYNVVEIRDRAFINNNITSLTLPNTLREIGDTAFSNNTITSLVIPNGVTAIGNNAFRFNQLTALVIPNTVVTLGRGAFGDNNLSAVTLPNNLSAILSNAFRNNSLTSISIPTSVTSIEDDAFFNNQLETLVIPDTVTSVGDGCFQDNNLTSISIGSGISVLNTDVFEGNQLTEVTIPSTVTNVSLRAFKNNPLTTVIVEATTPPSVITGGNNDSFSNRNTIDVFVPNGATQAYTDATWTSFKSVTKANKALALKVFLQGAAINPFTDEENLMRDDLRSLGLIPFESPYEDAEVLFDSTFVEITEGPDAIVDWIFVELRDASDSSVVIEGKSGLLQRDGDLVGIDAVSPLQFASTPDDYFIAIKHRNHLGAMIADTKRLSPVATIVDFTDANNPITFGNNAQTNFGMPSNVLGLWAGNVNGDNTLRFQGSGNDTNAIKDNVLADAGNTSNSNLHVFTGYNNGDVDLNGSIRFQGSGNDSNTIKDVVLSHPDNTTGTNLFLILEQLPEQAPSRIVENSQKQDYKPK